MITTARVNGPDMPVRRPSGEPPGGCRPSLNGSCKSMSDAKKDSAVKPLDNHATGGTETPQDNHATGSTETPQDNHATGEKLTTLDNHATGGTVTPQDNHATGEKP
ncbi:hypothetical protein GCM10009549_49610 [Streptomyces thermoalcalitolerans]|uniref:Uncharacterized protein n=2 Tax=Streptomyces thermoalcalitolerans TaxID=65605 RepID=A0ABN1PFX4_9ACTN